MGRQQDNYEKINEDVAYISINKINMKHLMKNLNLILKLLMVINNKLHY